jgi:hypothetical protein
MAGPLSTDLRERVVAAVNGGMSRRQAAAHFRVGVSSDAKGRSGSMAVDRERLKWADSAPWADGRNGQYSGRTNASLYAQRPPED